MLWTNSNNYIYSNLLEVQIKDFWVTYGSYGSTRIPAKDNTNNTILLLLFTDT